MEEFVTLAPGVHVSGNVSLGQDCYVGTGANIIEKPRVEDWAIVGAGAVEARDVPANSMAVGVPTKVIRTRPPGWYLA